MSAQVAADLRAAADVLERDGWTQGSYTDDNGCYCAAGAVLKAMRYDLSEGGDYMRAVEAFEAVLRQVLRAGSSAPEGAVIAWNDAAGRTAAEVIAALRAAADRAEAEL